MTTTENISAPVAGAETSGAGMSASDFTPEQLASMARWAVEDGHMSPEQAAEALAQDGIEAGPDALAGEADAGPRLEQFVLPTPVGRDMTPDEIEGDLYARGLLADAGFAAGLGSAFASEFEKIAIAHEQRTPAEKELYMQGQREILKRIWGSSFDEKLQVVIEFQEAFEAKHPGINEVLTETGTGYSATLCEYIYRQAMSRRG